MKDQKIVLADILNKAILDLPPTQGPSWFRDFEPLDSSIIASVYRPVDNACPGGFARAPDLPPTQVTESNYDFLRIKNVLQDSFTSSEKSSATVINKIIAALDGDLENDVIEDEDIDSENANYTAYECAINFDNSDDINIECTPLFPSQLNDDWWV